MKNNNENKAEKNKITKRHRKETESSEELLFNDFPNEFEFEVIMYPNINYTINLVKDTHMSFDCLPRIICIQFKEEYNQLRELYSIEISRYLKKNNEKYIQIQPEDFHDIPQPLYVELTSNEVWVSITFDIQAGNLPLKATSDIRVYRKMKKKDAHYLLLKTIISIWNHTHIDKTDSLKYNYLITGYHIDHDSSICWFDSKYNNQFRFSVKVNIKMISVEELIFKSFQLKYKSMLKDNKNHNLLWDTFTKINTFSSFAHHTLFEEEYKTITSLVHSQIFKLNKSSKIYVHYSTWKIKGDTLNISGISENEDSVEVNMIVSPKIKRNINKQTKKKEGPITPSSFQRNEPYSYESNTACGDRSSGKNYKELLHSDFEFCMNRRKTNKDGYITPCHVKIKFEKIHQNSNKLFKTFERETSIIHNKKSNEQEKDNKLNASKQAIKKTLISDLSKTINKEYVLNLINSSSTIKIPKGIMDRYAIPRIRNMKQEKTLVSYWNSFAQCYKSCSLCNGYVLLLIVLITCALIVYFIIIKS